MAVHVRGRQEGRKLVGMGVGGKELVRFDWGCVA